MYKNKVILTGIFVVIFGLSLSAQNGGVFIANLSMGLSSGSNSLLSKPSVPGFSVEGQFFVSDQVTIGGILGWNLLYKNYGYVKETNGTTTVSGNKRTFSTVIPAMLTAHYYFFKKRQVLPYQFKEVSPGIITPYLGVGLGSYIMTVESLMGDSDITNDYISFGIAPEVGISANFGNGLGVNFNIKYNIATKSGDNASTSWFLVNLGFAYIF